MGGTTIWAGPFPSGPAHRWSSSAWLGRPEVHLPTALGSALLVIMPPTLLPPMPREQ